MRGSVSSRAAVIFAGLATAVSGCAPAYQAEEVSAETHHAMAEIGNATAAALMQSSVMLVNPDLEQQLQQLAEELTPAIGAELSCRVHIVNNPAANALSLPNGDIFVFTGLLDVCANRDELAFVLGHEIAHIHSGHALEAMRKAFYASRLGSHMIVVVASMVGAGVGTAVSVQVSGIGGGSVSGAISASAAHPVGAIAARMAARVPVLIGEYAIGAVLASYSRAQEFEADRLGLIYATQAGYDPQAAASVMQRLAKIRTRE